MKIEALDHIDDDQAYSESLDGSRSHHEMGLSQLVDPSLYDSRVQVTPGEGIVPSAVIDNAEHDCAAAAVGEADCRSHNEADRVVSTLRALLEVQFLAFKGASDSPFADALQQVIKSVSV